MEQSAKPAEAPKPKSRNMVLAIIIVVILVVVGVSVYLLTQKSTPPPSGTPVTIYDNSGTCGAGPPATCGYKNSTGGAILRIPVGTMVVWTNSGTLPHTVTACVSSNTAFSSAVTDGACPSGGNAAGLQNFDSGAGGIAHGSTYPVTFNTAGNYSYYCSIHPWMKGTIIVS